MMVGRVGLEPTSLARGGGFTARWIHQFSAPAQMAHNRGVDPHTERCSSLSRRDCRPLQFVVHMAPCAGLGPALFRFVAGRSIQLSQQGVRRRAQDSNLQACRPTVFKTAPSPPGHTAFLAVPTGDAPAVSGATSRRICCYATRL